MNTVDILSEPVSCSLRRLPGIFRCFCPVRVGARNLLVRQRGQGRGAQEGPPEGSPGVFQSISHVPTIFGS